MFYWLRRLKKVHVPCMTQKGIPSEKGVNGKSEFLYVYTYFTLEETYFNYYTELKWVNQWVLLRKKLSETHFLVSLFSQCNYLYSNSLYSIVSDKVPPFYEGIPFAFEKTVSIIFVQIEWIVNLIYWQSINYLFTSVLI